MPHCDACRKTFFSLLVFVCLQTAPKSQIQIILNCILPNSQQNDSTLCFAAFRSSLQQTFYLTHRGYLGGLNVAVCYFAVPKKSVIIQPS